MMGEKGINGTKGMEGVKGGIVSKSCKCPQD